jgi:hypothetical protein
MSRKCLNHNQGIIIDELNIVNMDPPPSEPEEESVATMSYNAWNKGIDQLG